MDEGQELVAGVHLAGRRTQVNVPLGQLPKAEALGQGGRQEEPRIGDLTVLVEGHIEAVEAVRRSHQIGCFSVGLGGAVRNAISPVQMGT